MDLRLSGKVVRKAIQAPEGAFECRQKVKPLPGLGPLSCTPAQNRSDASVSNTRPLTSSCRWIGTSKNMMLGVRLSSHVRRGLSTIRPDTAPLPDPGGINRSRVTDARTMPSPPELGRLRLVRQQIGVCRQRPAF